MSNIDDLINESLSKEDEALLEHYSTEPGYFKQAMALFRGQLGWVMWFVGIVQLVFFLGAIYALVQAFTGDELMSVLRWGIVTVILVQLSTFLRGFMGAHFEANRVLREVKRLELRLVRMERPE
ncbi:hypothetical protein G4Y73_08915 [Wenzhouxiangella sp. XN201]|uniref:DUF6768 family protein n=1 Tax=Wenzhouxiangella sp. XN201 TaxID=2710755 RepID=UPI0013C9BB4E|nr:DUF6768 family protein [Wenzhouxiangella sp. XN201]NEZ04264.1 hypothetical protein [Wenzhouxiangella sp. XN201]